uniref:(California timema) hypothetical protein n=1 Tax=Timema californicum TaxID=61474 RepID=A0A7R9JIT7_TIMCA|nr:unnamed protein product [Timema californicum]
MIYSFSALATNGSTVSGEIEIEVEELLLGAVVFLDKESDTSYQASAGSVTVLTVDNEGNNLFSKETCCVEMSKLSPYGTKGELRWQGSCYPRMFEKYRNGQILVGLGDLGEAASRLRTTGYLSGGHLMCTRKMKNCHISYSLFHINPILLHCNVPIIFQRNKSNLEISFSSSVEPDEDISSDLSEQIQTYLASEFSNTSKTTLAAAIETYLKEAVANVDPDDYVY